MDEFEVIGGRQLYQWDTDRSIEVRLCDGETVNEVHYAHAEDDIAPVVKVQDYDGRMFADIPNILLQRFGTLKVWAVVYTEDGRQTLRNAYLSVRARAKPDDYVYTETEIMDYRKVAEDLAELVQRVEEIEENGVQGGGAVASVNGKTGEVYLNAADVGALPTTGGKLTGNLTAPRLISTAADAAGNIYEVQLYPTANGGLYMPLRHNGEVANAMSMSQSATTFGKPVAISSGGHGGKNAAEGRKNLEVDSSAEVDSKITARMGQITPDAIGAASQTEVIRLSNVKADKSEIPAPYILPTASADIKGGVRVGEGLQMDDDVLGVVPEGEYELLNEITVDEDTNAVTIDKTANGEPYNLKAVIVTITKPANTEKYILQSYTYHTGNESIRIVLDFTSAAAMGARMEVYPHHGYYKADGYMPSTAYSNSSNALSMANSNVCAISTKQNIYGVYFLAYSTGIIAAGTVIKIWGVRA